MQKYGFTREQQDEVALRSNNMAQKATESGRFAEEIIDVEVPQGRKKPPKVFNKDEHFRANLTMDDLSKMPVRFVSFCFVFFFSFIGHTQQDKILLVHTQREGGEKKEKSKTKTHKK